MNEWTAIQQFGGRIGHPWWNLMENKTERCGICLQRYRYFIVTLTTKAKCTLLLPESSTSECCWGNEYTEAGMSQWQLHSRINQRNELAGIGLSQPQPHKVNQRLGLEEGCLSQKTLSPQSLPIPCLPLTCSQGNLHNVSTSAALTPTQISTE